MTTETIVLLAWGGIALLVFWTWMMIELRKNPEDQDGDATLAIVCSAFWPFILVGLALTATLFGPPMLVAKLFKRKAAQP